MRKVWSLIAALGWGAWAGGAAQAHPHVFVDAEAALVIGGNGTLERIEYVWTFDDMYSAFAMQGAPRSGGAPTEEALAQLAEELVKKLEDVDFFTLAAAPDQELQAIGADNARARFDDGRLRLSFAVRLRALKGDTPRLDLRVYDPQYIVAITLRENVTFRGPAHCRLETRRPRALAPDEARQLDDSVRTNALAPDFGAKLASVVTLDCTRRE